MSPSKGVTCMYFAEVIFVMTISATLLGILKILDWMIMAYTSNEYCNMLLTLIPVIPELMLMQGNTVILVHIIQILMCFFMTGVACLWDRKCNTYGIYEYTSQRDSTNTSQWRSHNCRFGTRAMKKRMWYGMKIGTIPIKGPWSTSLLSIPTISLCTEDTSISRWLYPMDQFCEWLMIATQCRWPAFTKHSVDRQSIFYIWGHAQRPQQSPLALDNPHAACKRGLCHLMRICILQTKHHRMYVAQYFWLSF
jgi:hypothetical protein